MSADGSYKIGNSPHLNPQKYCNRDANTKEGTEIPRMTRNEMAWSAAVFFFNAAIVPAITPTGTANRSAVRLTNRDTGICLARIWKIGRASCRERVSF